ncbi:potassium-transporting ATPase subunit C [Leptospira paudalimensis]|uniref:Potassium-transporting ATPase subunit C n=1 Tax=Leptospira paudalimensis TaxID=2950024 RepID=A0ABT3M821_9LEPT|nr:potassium-transporting ATPase subunit C [Leptospira paudalimensis]MCW7504523.1 potassium-transporting ATPase subunit C [Leptospira paudalimensis]
MNTKTSVNQWEITIRFLFVSILSFGFLYPLAITGIGNLLFPRQTKGSLIESEGQILGTELFARNETGINLFQYRPSAVSYSTFPSGASNLSPSSLELKALVEERKRELLENEIDPIKCQELLYTSGSGLDPHITVDCALEQTNHLSKVTGVNLDTLETLVWKNVESPIFGFIGRARVNVTKLNQTWKQIQLETKTK